MNNLVSYIGKLNFYPENRSKKHKEQFSWKRTALIETNCDLEEYYRYFLKKRFGLNGGMQTIRGAHITFINDRVDDYLLEKYELVASKYNGTEIEFIIKLDNLRSNGYHWWFNIECPTAIKIREEIGLSSIPFFGFHFTICRFSKDNITDLEDSFKALKNCLFFNI